MAGRPDTWELRVFVGRSSEGKVRHKQKTFKGSRRDAERALARMVADQDASPLPAPEFPTKWGPTTTVNEAIAGWKENGWDDLSPKTAMDYECIWNRHIRNTIGKRRIATLSTYEVEKFFRRLKADGAGQHTVRMVRVVLNRACRLARKWSDGSLHNPVADSDLPRWKPSDGAKKEPVRSPTQDEVGSLLRSAEDEDLRIQAYMRAVAASGMRRGEACGLRWSDIDWDSGKIVIDESVKAATGGANVGETKTSDSLRTFHLDADTVTCLRNLWTDQAKLAMLASAELLPDAFVFSFQ
ncbi:MAG TPA: site-specific integrase, partial [Acidimicrobiales bacterium]|nr:site-specific integrase [Acidimicrobiales bacterium]